MDFLLNLAASGPTNGPGMFLENWLVLMYLGPETIMPLASILAAVLGFLLIFWRFIVNSIKKIFKRSKGDEIEGQAETTESVNYVDPLDE